MQGWTKVAHRDDEAGGGGGPAGDAAVTGRCGAGRVRGETLDW